MTDTVGKMQRLFVPLAREPYEWFQSGQKLWELRRLGRQYTNRSVRLGRVVELRRGYAAKDSSLWGVIANIATAATISSFFDGVSYSQVIPNARDRNEAEQVAADILGIDPHSPVGVIGFEIRIIDAVKGSAS